MAKQILLIEDDERTAAAVCACLNANGYEVTLAFDADAGLKEFVGTQPDLVFMDTSFRAVAASR